MYKERSRNIRKTWLLFTAFFVLVIGIGWIFGFLYDSPIILYIAVIFSVVMSFISYWYSDKIVLRMTRAKPVEKRDNPELYNIVENLVITAGLPMPKLYFVDEAAPNAFATGRDPKHAVVAVTRGLMERLNRSELEGVIAHELSHIGNRDMLVSTVAVVLVGFIAILSDMFMRSLFWGAMFGGRNRNGGGHAVFMLIGIAFAVLAPISAALVQLAISRKRELLADASGVLLTRYPEGLANALVKISSDPTPMRAAQNATAHLWLDDPFKGKKKTSWLHKLFMTHPPVEDRVKALIKMSI
ncbi:zinc metalloprotease HtpX [Candidatus Wolfebacteria bacterium RIFCSPLOWO2_01_FULL_45_19]|uniref:Protease HtpX homolog n=1 Tax=Candidatus Wolfebacteria bacterium RIFCSPLOWO2_01_FULL_45_19 TaxID=1802557 RepID=A0A1F8DU58_9BACT|nr:MAG: Protease HtpX-like protein [Parcubacteria group bacterium GW2011_GWB1_45_9]OGM91529.1 MAG: zinc metalloprotease HtpX [Candidatus Wolfebacteria bacterium RIFCSPLOWO2_01_FULL_45_19]